MKPNILLTCLLLLFSFTACSQKLSPTKLGAQIQKRLPAIIQEHRELVSLPNVSQYPEDMKKNAAWLVAAFAKRGFQAEVLEAGAIPIVFAERLIDKNKPTVLFYLHYDGQPVDPLEWDQKDPFIPTLKKQNAAGDWEEIDYGLTANDC